MESLVNSIAPTFQLQYSDLFREAFALFECLVDNPLELTVDASEFVSSPFLQGFHCRGVNPENKTFYIFLFGHDFLIVECSGIDYRLCSFIGA